MRQPIFVRPFSDDERQQLEAGLVLKVRGSSHERVLRELRITANSIDVLEAFQQFQGVLTGVPTLRGGETGPRSPRRPPTPGS